MTLNAPAKRLLPPSILQDGRCLASPRDPDGHPSAGSKTISLIIKNSRTGRIVHSEPDPVSRILLQDFLHREADELRPSVEVAIIDEAVDSRHLLIGHPDVNLDVFPFRLRHDVSCLSPATNVIKTCKSLLLNGINDIIAIQCNRRLQI